MENRPKPKPKKNTADNKKTVQHNKSGSKKTQSGKPVPSPKGNIKKSADDVRKMPPQKRIPQNEVDKRAEQMLHKPKKNTSSANKAYSKPLAPAKAPISPYKRRLKRMLFYILTVIILIAVCAVLSLTVFFKIDNIEVQGKTRYDTDEIIASSCINKGDNLILCNTGKGEEQIEKDFPYIEQVDIQKNLFNTIVINVKEAKPASIIESNGQYVVLSKSGKIIEIATEKKYSVPTILGANLKSAELSSTVEYRDKNIKKYVEDIVESVNSNELEDVETVDISNLSKITLIKKNGFKIIIGTPENIDYKIKTAKAITDKSVSSTDTGTLDVSLASADGGKSYLSQDKTESSDENSTVRSESENVTSKQESEENSEKSTEENSEESSEENTEESSEESSEENTEESSEESSGENTEETNE